MTKNLTLKKPLDLSNKEEMHIGRYCSLIKAGYVSRYTDQLGSIVPEVENITLKVFKEDSWGTQDSSIAECSAVQNVFSWAGFAPRVYDLFVVNDGKNKYIAQLTEEVMGDRPDSKEELEVLWRKMFDYAEENHLGMHLDTLKGNMVGNQWVDFQGFSFKPEYLVQLRLDAEENAQWQSDIAYQDIPELSIEGRRTEDRVGHISLRGSVVLDIGCSGGAESVSASRSGAKRVYGVDYPSVADVARRTANYLHAFNCEFYGYDDLKSEDFLGYIRRVTRRERFDIILFLSMHMHVGFPAYLKELMGKQGMLFEGHRELDDKRYQEDIEKAGMKYGIIGSTHDLGARHLYWVGKA